MKTSTWQDSRFQRELYIRGVITTVFAAIAYFILGAGVWVWIFPPVVVVLVLAKWMVRPEDDEEEPGPENHDRPV
jgi:fatty acid desaturase